MKTYMSYHDFVNTYLKEYIKIKNEFPDLFDEAFDAMGIGGVFLFGNGCRGLTEMAKSVALGDIREGDHNKFIYQFRDENACNVSFIREEGEEGTPMDYYKFTMCNGISLDDCNEAAMGGRYDWNEFAKGRRSGDQVVSAVVLDKTPDDLKEEKLKRPETRFLEIDSYAYQTVIRIARTLRFIKEKNPEFHLPPDEVLEKLAKEHSDQIFTLGIFLAEAGYGVYDDEGVFFKSDNMPEGYYRLFLITTYLVHIYPEEYGKVILEAYGGVKRASKTMWGSETIKDVVNKMIEAKEEFNCIIKDCNRDSDDGRFVEISSDLSDKIIDYICKEQEENGEYSGAEDFAKRFIHRVASDFGGDDKKGVLYLEIVSRNFKMDFPNGNQDTLHEWILLRYPDYIQYTYEGGDE